MATRKRSVSAVCCTLTALALVCLAGSAWAAAGGAPEFKGKLSERYEDSVERWPQTVLPAPKGAPLARGKNDVKFEFVHKGNFAGTSELFVNGKSVGKVDMPKTHPAPFSLSETFDVGRDNGAQVSILYTCAFPYTDTLDDTLDKVVFNLGVFPKAEEKGREAAETATVEAN